MKKIYFAAVFALFTTLSCAPQKSGCDAKTLQTTFLNQCISVLKDSGFYIDEAKVNGKYLAVEAEPLSIDLKQHQALLTVLPQDDPVIVNSKKYLSFLELDFGRRRAMVKIFYPFQGAVFVLKFRRWGVSGF